MSCLVKLLAVFLAFAVLACLAHSWQVGGLKAERDALAGQLVAAQASIKTYEASQAVMKTQISALQTLASGCEQSRAQTAADAEARQAILKPVTGRAEAANAAPRAAQGGETPPQPVKTEGGQHESTRAAVADRLNRPL